MGTDRDDGAHVDTRYPVAGEGELPKLTLGHLEHRVVALEWQRLVDVETTAGIAGDVADLRTEFAVLRSRVDKLEVSRL